MLSIKIFARVKFFRMEDVMEKCMSDIYFIPLKNSMEPNHSPINGTGPHHADQDTEPLLTGTTPGTLWAAAHRRVTESNHSPDFQMVDRASNVNRQVFNPVMLSFEFSSFIQCRRDFCDEFSGRCETCTLKPWSQRGHILVDYLGVADFQRSPYFTQLQRRNTF